MNRRQLSCVLTTDAMDRLHQAMAFARDAGKFEAIVFLFFIMSSFFDNSLNSFVLHSTYICNPRRTEKDDVHSLSASVA